MPCPFHQCADKCLAPPKAALIILVASVIALAFAFIMQYGFGYQPCILCLWQRVPYAAAIILSGIALVPALRAQARILFGFCTLAFIAGAGLAIFHLGVELHWWLGTSGCTIPPLHGTSAEDLRQQLLHTVAARCDEVQWKFLGLSMANDNVIYSLALAGFSFCATRKTA